jgi:hypothetical protein
MHQVTRTWVAALALFGCRPVFAMSPGQTPVPGDWSVVANQPQNTPVVLTLQTGDELIGQLTGVGPDDLTVAMPNGVGRKVPKSLVREVATPQARADRVSDGALRGALIGVGACLALTAAIYASCGEGCEAPAPGGPLAFAVAVGLGGGAAVGALVDRGHRSRLVLYRTARRD